MAWIGTDHADDTTPSDDLALVTHLAHGGTHFHAESLPPSSEGPITHEFPGTGAAADKYSPGQVIMPGRAL
jgi:hypothetical protein